MTTTISSLWSGDPPAELSRQLHDLLSTAIDRSRPTQVFFRADDIGGPVDEPFSRLMRVFASHHMPLCLAVVPAWLNQERWREMQRFEPESPGWCWHQHGWQHKNHEAQGKKSEFGDSRTRETIAADLHQGRDRLAEILGPLFVPVFTPPWNRCGETTLQALSELGYAAISRAQGAKPASPANLPDLDVNIDLHTRREQDPRQGWANLLSEFREAARYGRMGIMIHHQRMNNTAFAFLDLLLPLLKAHQAVSCCNFKTILRPAGNVDPTANNPGY
ncbi:MAG: polysaccharide deacetylase family protein [Deltaproteobacteria bacterium]|nr:polysaccharide deacetylase family protein [Deltaproteobacteria bacterium]